MYFRYIAIGIVALSVYPIAATAQDLALTPKLCLPISEMNAALKASGQRTLVIGDRRAVNDAPERSSGVRVTNYANAITANADGSIGYQLEGDLPRAQSSTTMCVAAKLTNIRLFDARKPGTLPDMLLGGAYDTEVREKEKLGTRPMVIADTVSRGPDGSERLGLQMILFGNVKGRSASLYARLPNGKGEALILMDNTDYTPFAIQQLDARP